MPEMLYRYVGEYRIASNGNLGNYKCSKKLKHERNRR
jgi:hypothetical protein